MISLKENAFKLKELLESISSKDINLKEDTSKENYSFKKRQIIYYKQNLEKSIVQLKNCLSFNSNFAERSIKTELEGFNSQFQLIESLIRESKFDKAASLLAEEIKNLPEIEESEPIQKNNNFQNNTFFLPHVPREIYHEVKANFDELERSFKAKCYRSSLILCGKILEIVLHRKYFEETKKDLLEKSPDIGLGNLIVKMKEKNIELDPGLPQQIHFVNQLRVFSVHRKLQPFMPSRAQAQASILYTLDIVKKLFKNSKPNSD